MHATILPALAVLGALLLLAHAARSRGPRFATALALSALAFGWARPLVVRWISTALAGAPPPYEYPADRPTFLHGAPLEAIGWLFAATLGVALGARLAARSGRPGHVPTEAAWAALVLGAVSYAVESAAGPAGLWRWNVSATNRFFHDVPGVAVLDWLTVGPDFVLPLLLLAPGRPPLGRARLAALLVFPAHMAAHAADALALPLGGLTPSRGWHAATLAACLAAPFLAPKLARAGSGSGDRSILPDLAALLLLAATAFVHASLAKDPAAAAVTGAPLAILVLLARVRPPALAALGLGAAALLVLFGARGIPSAIPLAVAAIARASVRERTAAIGASFLLALGLAGVAILESRHRETVSAIRRADAAYAAGRHAQAIVELDAALAAEPRNAIARHKRGLVLFGLRRTTEARQEIDRALAEAPTDAEMLFSSAIFFEAIGDEPRGAALRERAARLRPLDPPRIR